LRTDIIDFIEREMTSAEYELVKAGFDENSQDNGNPVETSERHGFVAIQDGVFIGCSSGLATKNGNVYNGWFYLTDLYVEKASRRKGYGKALLKNLEDKIKSSGISKIWTWTAGYEAPEFYRKQGYDVFAEFPHWYKTGHSRFGLWKQL
jgi:ribosomal protein S18 acetylase RimI-like enzyme